MTKLGMSVAKWEGDVAKWEWVWLS
jgi:hypothetical protein